MRLQKILSAYGISSRREAEKLIQSGRVAVNGTVATLGQSAIPGVDVIEVDGKKLGEKDQSIYIMLNKPKGYLTTVSDDRGRKTVMELIDDLGVRVYPVGRLDNDSEGLLLLTNDGEFANAVAHPSNGKTKTYEVQVKGDAKRAVSLLQKPVVVDGYTVRAAEAVLTSASEERSILRITIVEGRKRQVRRMCAVCGLTVLSLRRISIGSLKLGTLETGKWRFLTNDEVDNLRL